MMIIGGTSLAVYPAAGLIHYFKGDTLALVNRDPTPMDARADLVLHEKISKRRALGMLIIVVGIVVFSLRSDLNIGTERETHAGNTEY